VIEKLRKRSGRSRVAPDGLITARDVASRAGVSISAVSRAFTEGASISSETRSKVFEASNALGYRPNRLARSLMTRRTELIGLISNNFDNPFFMEIFDLFTRELQERGLRPLLVNLTGGGSSEAAFDLVLQYRVDGVIVASSSLQHDVAEACARAKLPVVQVFGRPARSSGVAVVGTDNVRGGQLAAKILIDEHYRRIALLGGPREAPSTQDRLAGFREALTGSDTQLVIESYGLSFSYSEGKRLMTELLHQNRERFDAVFCGDDIMAIGALDACRDAGISVPRDLGILGFDDIPMASWSAYELSTIRQPVDEVIRTAIDLIVSMVNGERQRFKSRLFLGTPVLRGTLREKAG
jgi:DNA-binding LacI/PurR family transcriptional regulator